MEIKLQIHEWKQRQSRRAQKWLYCLFEPLRGWWTAHKIHKSPYSNPPLFSTTPGTSSRRFHFLAALIFNKLLASDLIMPLRAIFIFYKHK